MERIFLVQEKKKKNNPYKEGRKDLEIQTQRDKYWPLIALISDTRVHTSAQSAYATYRPLGQTQHISLNR